MHRRILAFLASDSFGAVLGNIEAQNVIAVAAELVRIWVTLLLHFDLGATIHSLLLSFSV